MSDTLGAVLAAVFGLAFGSFLNVVVYRVPRHLSIVAPGSQCPSCDTPIRAYDNIPVLSWLILRGKCRACGAAISPRYMAGELLTAGLWALIVLEFGVTWEALAFLPFAWVLVCLSLIDLEHQLIPSRILYPFAAAGVGLLAVAAWQGPSWTPFVRAVAAGGASFLAFNVIHFVSPSGMGYGDVRLSGLLGLYLGYLPRGWARVFLGFLIGFLLGAVVGVLLMAFKKAGRKTALPFGPFLAAGSLISALWGGPVVRAWLG